MTPETVLVAHPRDRRAFIELPYRLYRGSPNWVPPLRSEMRSVLDPSQNPLFAKGPHALFLARAGGQVVGRVGAAVDREINRRKGTATGSFFLFESVNDRTVARALFDTALGWLRDQGMTRALGPVSPTNGDDYRGLLIDAFDRPPVLFDSYNFDYYPALFEGYGLERDNDLFAYDFDLHPEPDPRQVRAAEYAQRKFGYHLDPVDLGRLDREVDDIKRILDEAMPEEWADLAPPTRAELMAMARRLAGVADPRFILIARTTAGRPVGFNLALPNLNEVFIRMGGRLLPFGWLKFLLGRRRITSGRFFVLFVVPEYRLRGVAAAIVLDCVLEARRRGYHWGEGSTIGETNLPMRRVVENLGGIHSRTYRIYHKTW